MTLLDLGFSLGIIPAKDMHDTEEAPYYIREGAGDRTVVFIAGFGQPMDSWRRILQDVFLHTDDTLVVIGRRHEKSARYRQIGWLTIRDQVVEAHHAFHYLFTGGPLIGKHNIMLVAHSIGAVIARAVFEWHGPRFSTLVQIAPVPPYGWCLWHLNFWKHAGLSVVSRATAGLLFPWKGFRPSLSTVRGLFTGPNITEHQLLDYHSSLVGDSTAVFLELLMAYSGTEIWDTVAQKWHGNHVLIACGNDTAIRTKDVRRMSHDVRQGTFTILPNTPHCLQFSIPEVWAQNVVILREKLECYPAGKVPKRKPRSSKG